MSKFIDQIGNGGGNSEKKVKLFIPLSLAVMVVLSACGAVEVVDNMTHPPKSSGGEQTETEKDNGVTQTSGVRQPSVNNFKTTVTTESIPVVREDCTYTYIQNDSRPNESADDQMDQRLSTYHHAAVTKTGTDIYCFEKAVNQYKLADQAAQKSAKISGQGYYYPPYYTTPLSASPTLLNQYGLPNPLPDPNTAITFQKGTSIQPRSQVILEAPSRQQTLGGNQPRAQSQNTGKPYNPMFDAGSNPNRFATPRQK